MKKRPVLATFVSGAFATGAILGVCSQVLGGEIAEIVPSINAPQPALSINTSAPGDFLQKYQEQSYVKIADSTATHLDAVMGTPNSGRGDKTLLPGEFYTFLTMVNGFHDNEVIKNCGNVNSKSTYATVKAEIDYIGLNGMASGTLGSQLILFAVGNPNTSTSSLDCIFNSTGDQRGPYIIFSDFPLGQGEYNIHFGVVGGWGSPTQFIEVIAKLALAAAGVFPGFSVISGPASGLVNAGAAAFDSLLSQKNSVSYQYLLILSPTRPLVDKINKPRYWNGYYANITSPAFLPRDAGGVEFYQRRSASIVLDSNSNKTVIKPNDVLWNPALGASHRCIPGVGSCPKENLFTQTLGTDFDLSGDFKATDPPKNK